MNAPSSSMLAARDRRVPLGGAVNFRDIGGYPAADGRVTRWGRLYRSDSLAELSDADLTLLQSLGLRSVCDLRHDTERSQRPNRLHPDDAPLTHDIGFFVHGAEALLEGVRSRQLSAAEVRDVFMEAYKRLPVDQAPACAQFLQKLLAPDALPLVHCTSGKDRTGFGAAVVLLALGVSRDLVIEDYVLTNRYRRDLSFMLGSDVDAEVLAVVKAAEPAFLPQAFHTIDTAWGGTTGFLRQGLGLSEQDQTRLQALLLEG